jgi:hypothetical protein
VEWSAHACICFRPLAMDLSCFLFICFTVSYPSVLSLHNFVGVVWESFLFAWLMGMEAEK